MLIAIPVILPIFFGGAPRLNPPNLWLNPDHVYAHIGSTPLNGGEIATTLITVVVVAALVAMFRWTGIGLQMRAVVESRRMSQLEGINAPAVAAGAWALSSTLAGLAGVLLLPLTPEISAQDPYLFTTLLVAGLTAAAVASMRSLPIALAAAVGLGVVENLLQGYLPSGCIIEQIVDPAFPFVVLVGALLFNPGLRTAGAELRPAGVGRPSAGPTVDQRSATAAAGTCPPGSGSGPHGGLLGVQRHLGSRALVCPLRPGLVRSRSSSCRSPSSPAWAASCLCARRPSPASAPSRAGQIRRPSRACPCCSARWWWAAGRRGRDRRGPRGHPGVGPAAGPGDPGLRPLRRPVALPVLVVGRGLTGVTVPRPRDRIDRLRLGPLVPDALLRGPGVVCVLVLLVQRGTVGRYLAAMRGSPTAAASLGISLRTARLTVFAMSAGIAGFGGALYGSVLKQVNADLFGYVFSLVFVVAVITTGSRPSRGPSRRAWGSPSSSAPDLAVPAAACSSASSPSCSPSGAMTYAAHPEGIVEYQKSRWMVRVSKLLQRLRRRDGPQGRPSLAGRRGASGRTPATRVRRAVGVPRESRSVAEPPSLPTAAPAAPRPALGRRPRRSRCSTPGRSPSASAGSRR